MPTAADVLRAEVLQKILIDQIKIKFGAVDAAARARIEAADLLQLREWLRRIVTAPTVDAVFAS